jgi:DNA-binding response OmpR family regulator
MRILVVDDGPTVSSAVEWVLAHQGYRVQVARDALEALAMLPDFRPEVIILDLRMPDAESIRLCEMFRSKPGYETVPLIVVSGLPNDGAIERVVAAGCDDYIAKPVNNERLLSIVEGYLESGGITY